MDWLQFPLLVVSCSHKAHQWLAWKVSKVQLISVILTPVQNGTMPYIVLACLLWSGGQDELLLFDERRLVIIIRVWELQLSVSHRTSSSLPNSYQYDGIVNTFV